MIEKSEAKPEVTTEVTDVKIEDGKVSLEVIDTPVEKSSEITEESPEIGDLNAQEIEMAKKHDLIKPKEKSDDKEGKESKEGAEKEEKGEEIKKEASKEMTDAEEHDLLSNYNKNERGLYWGAKNERKRRQAAELERDFIKTKTAALEDKVALLEGKKPVEDQAEEGQEEDIFGEIKDDDVLTGADLKRLKAREREIEAKKAEIAKLKQDEHNKKALEFDAKLVSLENNARVKHTDFDETIELAQEILKDPKKVFGDDKQMIGKATALVKAFYAEMNSSVNDADPDYNVTDITYELGKLHPKSKENNELSEGSEELGEKKVGRILSNASKRISSASLTGGRRIMSADSLTMQDVANMSLEKYSKLPKDVRERFLREAG